ncbi:MAG: TonB-dependent receptor [Candidatus Moduliflexus flocculans]|nr:TonB-dependent receptor [Candidatus Moduliflexus flocculans]
MLYDSAGYFYYADRARFGTNASVTHYAEDFLAGSHEFKFGAEFERSMARSRYGFTGTGGELGDNVNYYDYYSYGYSGPYLAYQYAGYDTNTRYTRLETFVQDSWQIGKRLNLSLGLRYSHELGRRQGRRRHRLQVEPPGPPPGLHLRHPGRQDDRPQGPLRALHRGHADRLPRQDEPGRRTSATTPATTGTSTPKSGSRCSGTSISPTRWIPNIKHPYMAQFTVGLERELFKDTSLSRDLHRPEVEQHHRPLRHQRRNTPRSRTTPRLSTSPSPSTNGPRKRSGSPTTSSPTSGRTRPTPASSWIPTGSSGASRSCSTSASPTAGSSWPPTSTATPRARSTTASPTTSATAGASTIRTSGSTARGRSPTTRPTCSRSRAPTSCPSTSTSTSTSGASRATPGRRASGPLRFNQGRITFFAEERGANHYPMAKNLDLRLEKIFTIAKKYRLGVMADVFNVFNDDTLTSWGTRIGYDWNEGDYPSTDGHELYSIVRPRQARVGLRLIF